MKKHAIAIHQPKTMLNMFCPDLLVMCNIPICHAYHACFTFWKHKNVASSNAIGGDVKSNGLSTFVPQVRCMPGSQNLMTAKLQEEDVLR